MQKKKKKAAYTNTLAHPVSVECHRWDAQLDPSRHLAFWWSWESFLWSEQVLFKGGLV